MQLQLLKQKHDHVAIMRKDWHLIAKILSGEKTIESRWYKTRRLPWDHIQSGDTVYFKNSGEEITAKATVSKVLQFANLNLEKITEIAEKYAAGIALRNKDVKSWGSSKNYCVLIFLENPQEIQVPFEIDKKGFGIGAAWITVDDIKTITR